MVVDPENACTHRLAVMPGFYLVSQIQYSEWLVDLSIPGGLLTAWDYESRHRTGTGVKQPGVLVSVKTYVLV